MSEFNSKYTGAEVEALLDVIDDKQDNIEDLETIRDGASKGATALQSIPTEYVTEDQLIWTKVEGEAGVRLKGTNGTATGNLAISAGDDKTASDGTPFASVASGDHAVAFGYGNTCSGRTTLAQGLYNIVTAKDSVAFGQRNTVSGDQAFAAGQQNEVLARIGVAIGYKNKATNTDSIAIGYQNTSSGSASVAMGDTCEASGTSSTAMGYKTKAAGASSSTFGENTQATNEGEVAMGKYNKSTTSTDTSEQTSFSFGIGTSDTNRINALEIKKNGDVYIGDKLLSVEDFMTAEDLATVATSGSYNDLTDKPTIPSEQVNADWNATSGKAQILNKPTIPSRVTESTVSGWGFTKNTGTYSKPSSGIPASDLASDVRDAISKSDGAVQCYIAQTTLYELLYDDGLIALPQNDMQGILDALTQRKLVLFPDAYGVGAGTENSGYGVMISGAAEDLLYFSVADTSGSVYSIEVNLDGTIVSRKEISLTIYNTKTINGQSLVGSGDITIEGGGSSVYVMEDVMFTDLGEGFSVGQGEFDRIKESILNAKQIAVLDDRSTRGGYLYATQTNVLAQEDHINLTFVADDSVYQLSMYENDGLIDYYRVHTIGSSSGSSAMPLVDHGTNGTTSMIAPNVFHKWGEVASLTLTLGAETAGVANQYTFEFASGETATVLALPDRLKWADDNVPTIEPNMIYQISILNGMAVALKFKNAKLITNNLTVSGTTLTFDYPVASKVEVQVKGDATVYTSTFASGDHTKKVILGPLESVKEVLSIIPAEDSVYKYVYNA